VQNRATAIDSAVARPFGWQNTPGSVFVNKAVDGTRWWMWETYRFGQRLAGELFDEKMLNKLEDAADKNLNRFRLQPAEIVVAPGSMPPEAASPLAPKTTEAQAAPPPAPPAP
jgi:hypothetical protein